MSEGGRSRIRVGAIVWKTLGDEQQEVGKIIVTQSSHSVSLYRWVFLEPRCLRRICRT
jgi:hypothetical protein